jgi:hypothetical protein
MTAYQRSKLTAFIMIFLSGMLALIVYSYSSNLVYSSTSMLIAFLVMVLVLVVIGKVSPTSLALETQVTSKNKINRILFLDNHNRCSDCLKPLSKALRLSSTGYCGKCGRLNHVWCNELISLYLGLKISEDDICRYLPLINHKQAPIDFSFVGKKISEFNIIKRK